MTGVCMAVSVQVAFWLRRLYGSRGNLLAGCLNGSEGRGLKRMAVLVILTKSLYGSVGDLMAICLHNS